MRYAGRLSVSFQCDVVPEPVAQVMRDINRFRF